ncbi:MAG: formate/nitrite transporter family protein, partial [Gammaproteobacteria bacterium]|nr:formate/nitrite transporter family protein [Gammaproteobacteria bacterium]
VETSKYIINTSEVKARLTTPNTILLAIMAGIYVGMGAFGYIFIGQTMGNIDVGLMKFFGAAVFPVGLMLVVFTGSELFTGDTLMTMAVLDKRINFPEMMRTWILVYLGNLIGSIALAFAIYKSGMITGATEELVLKVAGGKLSLDFTSAVIRGLLCNILVVLGMWLSYSAQDVGSKILGIWFPVMLFVLVGFEHSVANMFFLPLAKFVGIGPSWIDIFTLNIIPVTIGNILAGGIMIPFVYYNAHIQPLKDN